MLYLLIRYLAPIGSRHATTATAFLGVNFLAAIVSVVAAHHHWNALFLAAAIVLVIFSTDLFFASIELRRMIEFRELQQAMNAERADR